MANTEGLTDEALHSLLSIDNDTESSSNHPHDRNRHRKPFPSRGNRQRFDRMAMMDAFDDDKDNDRMNDMDIIPSARVIRPSRQSSSKSKLKSKSQTTTTTTTTTTNNRNRIIENSSSTTSSTSTSTTTTPHRSVFVSERIMERPVSHVRMTQMQSNNNLDADADTGETTTNIYMNTTAPKSRFLSKIHNKKTSNGIQGFPSMNIPFGSLTRKNNNHKNPETNVNLDSTTTTTQMSNKHYHSTTKNINTQSISTSSQNVDDGNHDDDDASLLFQNMSLSEIREAQSEIQSALSSESIQFLQTRGKLKKMKLQQEKKQQNQKQKQKQTPSQQSFNTNKHDKHVHFVNNSGNSSSPKDDKTNYNHDSKTNEFIPLEEKIQMANLLSSIQTENELDEAFAKYHATTHNITTTTNNNNHNDAGTDTDTASSHNPLTDSHENNNNHDTDKDINDLSLDDSTKLLRSTEIRQRALGVKKICHLLEAEIDDMIVSCDDKDGLSNSNSPQHHLTSTETQSQQHPQLLPVALRCLLDSSSPVKKHLMYSHTLRALHALILLHIHPNQRIITHPHHVTHSMIHHMQGHGNNAQMSLSLNYMEDIIMPYHHNHHGKEGGDSQSQQQQQSTSTNTIMDKANIEGSGVYYATDPSTKQQQSATADSKAFYSDPSWTLLSRMRIIPRLAEIVQLCIPSTSTSIPNKYHDVHHHHHPCYSVESHIALCGILANMAKRSPGAACAIAAHKVILPKLVFVTLSAGSNYYIMQQQQQQKQQQQPSSSSSSLDISPFPVHAHMALPTLILLRTLVLQSRTAATSMLREPFSIIERIQPLLSITPENDVEYACQRYSLVLWRTFLRYGLGFTHITTLLPLAVANSSKVRSGTNSYPYYSGGKNSSSSSSPEHGIHIMYDMSSDFSSACSAVCDCARIATKHNALIKTKDNSFKVEETSQLLMMVGTRIVPHVRACAESLIHDNQPIAIIHNENSKNLKIFEMTSKLSLLRSYLSAIHQSHHGSHSTVALNEEKYEQKSQTLIPAISPNVFANALKSILLLDAEIMRSSLNITLRYAMVPNWSNIPSETQPNLDGETSLAEEALSCCFVRNFFSTLWRLINPNDLDGVNFYLELVKLSDLMDFDLSNLLTVAKSAFEMVLEILNINNQQEENSNEFTDYQHSKERMKWLNSSQFALCKFLVGMSNYFKESNHDVKSQNRAMPAIQSFSFSLLGKLCVGDEAMAMMLLSQNELFNLPSSNSISANGSLRPSSIQITLMEEICRTKDRRLQLDHSYKIFGGPGITSFGGGMFTLESLRCEIDACNIGQPTQANQQPNSDSDCNDALSLGSSFLPLDGLWLWNMLSSTVISPGSQLLTNASTSNATTSESKKASDNSIGVVISTLDLLLHMEQSKSQYTKNFDDGIKLYHLFNSSLYPEMIIRDDTFRILYMQLLNSLLDSLRSNLDPICELNMSSIKSFAKACFEHSCKADQKRTKMQQPTEEETQNYDEKVFEIFNFHGSEKNSNPNLKTFIVQPFRDFVADVCTAFCEYGAQYEIYAPTLRFFLRPEFPTIIRQDILSRLSHLLHLLTTDTESNHMDSTHMIQTLQDSLGGCMIRDVNYTTWSDPADFLGTISSLLKSESSNKEQFSRLLGVSGGGYFYLLAISYMARNLASSSSQHDENRLNLLKQLMMGMRKDVLSHIVSTANLLCHGLVEGEQSAKTISAARKVSLSVVSVCVKNQNVIDALDTWEGKDNKNAIW
eukprot:CAMPEP_0184862466 /NCGR_PEP_ID=MMETSP0580-20130426/6920_1 /TAXON_ID=1118495 /ORGANISM="Dactyliosolen fragilissimus" /LENGTH=1736 /DNA_ID=CAMNT_0027360345 /DNA_START=692 /DNA_END=5899 /DNA_ORIENTATION=+